MWMTLMRLNRKADAAKVLERITPKMDILENGSYHRRLLMYKGLEKPEALLDTAKADDTTDRHAGLRRRQLLLVTGNTAKAREVFQKVTSGRRLERLRIHRRRGGSASHRSNTDPSPARQNRNPRGATLRQPVALRAVIAVATRLQPSLPMAANTVKIGVACPITGERAAFLEWLTLAGYEPVPMLNLDGLGRDVNARPIEALIADVSLVPPAELPRIVRLLGPNRPLIVVGDPKDAIEEVPRDATWVDRPVARDTFLLSVALGLAEGRPARRSPRRLVPRLLSSVDGVTSKVVDVSTEGVRLEIAGASPSVLPPYFLLKVPGFGVSTKVKRVWVAAPKPGQVWCGGVIEKPELTRRSTRRGTAS